MNTDNTKNSQRKSWISKIVVEANSFEIRATFHNMSLFYFHLIDWSSNFLRCGLLSGKIKLFHHNPSVVDGVGRSVYALNFDWCQMHPILLLLHLAVCFWFCNGKNLGNRFLPFVQDADLECEKTDKRKTRNLVGICRVWLVSCKIEKKKLGKKTRKLPEIAWAAKKSHFECGRWWWWSQSLVYICTCRSPSAVRFARPTVVKATLAVHVE